MRNLLFFQSMLTPKCITVIYWLLLALTVLTTLGAIFADFSLASLVKGLIFGTLGAFGVRVWCELMIVMFKIHENLAKLVEMKQQEK